MSTENNVTAQDGDFDPAPKYEYSSDGKTVTWTNRDRMPKVAAQAGDESMRALPHLPRAVGYLHTMDNTEGLKGNQPWRIFNFIKRNPFGKAGLDYSASYPVTNEALFTASQMKEYARAALADMPRATADVDRDALAAALQVALDVIDDYLDYEHNGDPWTEDARTMGEMDINDYGCDGRMESARALLLDIATTKPGA